MKKLTILSVILIAVMSITISCTRRAASVVSTHKSVAGAAIVPAVDYAHAPMENTEGYSAFDENQFLDVLEHPLSTFSVDVDTASYSNARRFISEGELPPKDAVRIEEFINYFNYRYDAPKGDEPFSINAEVSASPWNAENKIVHIGLQGKDIDRKDKPASNLVFLIDVSGSMSDANKLPLLKSSFKLLVDQLDKNDRIAIVTYAGAAGVALSSTRGSKKDKILESLQNLEAGGSTAGGQGIELAYEIAERNFKKRGNNRIILATDGDFNVGISSDQGLEDLIEEKRETGIFLSVIGFGSGNLQDSKMETLADHGNGNYYYIDNLFEARKVLVNEVGSTLITIAKDVKIQIEFNPTKVKQYRLIGYENRLLNREDFDDDTKDAGEIGAGHSVTALYEVVPANANDIDTSVSGYKYQNTEISEDAYTSGEIASVKFRYKKPDEDKSALIESAILDKEVDLDNTSDSFRFAASVAEFGLLLRDSEFKGDSGYDQVIALASSSKGDDQEGYRSEFIRMVKLAKDLTNGEEMAEK